MQGKVGWQTYLGRKTDVRNYLFRLSLSFQLCLCDHQCGQPVKWVIKMPPPRCEREKHFAESRSCRGIKGLLWYLNLGLHLKTPGSTVLKVSQNYFNLEINCIKQRPIIGAARRKKSRKLANYLLWMHISLNLLCGTYLLKVKLSAVWDHKGFSPAHFQNVILPF